MLAPLCGLLLTAVGGCKSRTPPTAEQAHGELTAAAARGDAAEVYRLLDRKTQWSLISAFESDREIRQLVLQHYPADRRARELRRTQLLVRAGNPPAYFLLIAQRDGLLERLARAQRVDGQQDTGEAVVVRSADQQLAYCREDKGFKYCGLREQFEELKIRGARDLELVRENAEAFQKGR